MNLTAIDHEFINLVVRSIEHRTIIIRRLEAESPLALQISTGRYMTFVRNLLRYILFLNELLLAITKRRNLKPVSGIPFYDSSPQSLAGRVAYLKYQLPDEHFHGISYQCRLVAVPGLKEKVPIVVRLGILLVRSFFQRSELGAHYVRIVRTCLLAHSHMMYSPQSSIYLFQIYRVEMVFAAAYLRERGIFVNLIPGTSPLTPHNKYLIGDSLKICNPYQRDEFMYYRDLGTCQHYELWSPEEIYLLAPYYKARKIAEHPDIIGLYTQGFWLRTRMGTVGRQIGEDLTYQEGELVQILLACLQERPSIRLVIYPHPMERRYFSRTEEHQFGAIQEYARVTINFSGESSILSFDQVGLGITTMSTVGFDRIYMGFRTLFYTPHSSFPNPEIPSPYNALFLEDREQLLAQIDRVRNTSHAEFMQQYFHGFFWSSSASLVGEHSSEENRDDC